MRKIVFIAANIFHPWGGSEYLWSAAAESFARRGVQVYVSVKDWGAPVKQVEHLRSLGCRIFLRGWPPSLAARLGRKTGLLPGYTHEHIQRVGAGADLIVVSQGGHVEGLQWMEASRSNSYRYAIIAQAAAEEWWPDDDVAERLAEAYENACCAYFVSEANLALSRRQFVTPLSRARVIRNPFNVRYDARPAWSSDPSGGLSLACIGRLDPKAKGQDLLIEVLNLPHWRDRNVHVSLFGNGVNERGLRRWVDNVELTKISFSGFVGDIEEVWSKHHALVLPSRYEGMPLVLVEAMLCGRPGIVTDVAGHRELVRDGVNGFLAKAPTVELLDEAMNRAWENRHRLKEMGEAAARDVRQWVSPDPTEDFVHELTALAEAR
ncbi:MAG: glycosyltransferase family 4 protein [Candidatus Acidiferrales bacterium]